MKMKIELAWAAGFFDGEGSTKKIYYRYKTKKGIKCKPSRNVCMSVSQSEITTLKRFKKAINGIGHINGPYQYKPNRRPYWTWSVSCKSARETFKLLKPYLSQPKKDQYKVVYAELFTVPSRKKGWLHDEGPPTRR